MWTLSDPGQPGGPAGGVAPAQALAPAGRTEGRLGRALFICAGVPGRACRSMFCIRNISIYFCIRASACLGQALSAVLGSQLMPSEQGQQGREKRLGSPRCHTDQLSLHTQALSWWALAWQHLTPVPTPCPLTLPHLSACSAPASCSENIPGPTGSCGERFVSQLGEFPGFPVVPWAPPSTPSPQQGTGARALVPSPRVPLSHSCKDGLLGPTLHLPEIHNQER